MSTKHVRTDGDVLRFGCSVQVTCGYCRSTTTFRAFDWVMAAGGKSLEAARRRLRCSRCGRKAARIAVSGPE